MKEKRDHMLCFHKKKEKAKAHKKEGTKLLNRLDCPVKLIDSIIFAPPSVKELDFLCVFLCLPHVFDTLKEKMKEQMCFLSQTRVRQLLVCQLHHLS